MVKKECCVQLINILTIPDQQIIEIIQNILKRQGPVEEPLGLFFRKIIIKFK